MSGRIFGITSFRAVAALALLSLAGCGISYTSPRVDDGDSNTPVTVHVLTPTVIAEANRSSYTPRSLPAAFHSVASGGSLVGLGALPVAPDIPRQRRVRLEYRPLPAATPGPYRIGVGDVVLLATKGNASTVEQLSGLLAAQNQRQGYTVRDDGAIAIPEVGTVKLAGMTLQEAEDKLFQVLVENQIDPSFSLEVAEFNSKRVAVGGAVKNASLVPVTLNPLSLGEALTAAGGMAVTDVELASIRIYRDGTLYQIPVETYLGNPELRSSRLIDGDAVYVDTTYDLDRAMEFYRQRLDVISLRSGARGAALSTLQSEISLQRDALNERRDNFQARTGFDAEDRDYVYLTGEVNKQSRFALPYERQANLADVLYSEGGFDNTTGNPSQIYVLRGAEDGTINAYHLDARNAANLVMATKMQMRPNDVVFIEEQPITKWGRALQQLFPVLTRAATSSL